MTIEDAKNYPSPDQEYLNAKILACPRCGDHEISLNYSATWVLSNIGEVTIPAKCKACAAEIYLVRLLADENTSLIEPGRASDTGGKPPSAIENRTALKVSEFND